MVDIDVGMLSEALNQKADRDINNLTDGGYKYIDGQWTPVMQSICSGVSGDSSFSAEYSIADFLPNDGYNYEVLISGGGRTGATSGNSIQMWVGGELTLSVLLVYGITRTASYMAYGGNAIIPVGTARKVKLACTNATGTSSNMYLQLRGYRRIGTNI